MHRAVAVPEGEHTVRFWFDPVSVKVGLAISLLALLATLGLVCLPLLTKARRLPSRG